MHDGRWDEGRFLYTSDRELVGYISSTDIPVLSSSLTAALLRIHPIIDRTFGLSVAIKIRYRLLAKKACICRYDSQVQEWLQSSYTSHWASLTYSTWPVWLQLVFPCDRASVRPCHPSTHHRTFNHRFSLTVWQQLLATDVYSSLPFMPNWYIEESRGHRISCMAWSRNGIP